MENKSRSTGRGLFDLNLRFSVNLKGGPAMPLEQYLKWKQKTRMARAKRERLADYGLLAQRYVSSFEQKWVLRDPAPSEELLGAADIQSLADLGNSYALVREMRSVPLQFCLLVINYDLPWNPQRILDSD